MKLGTCTVRGRPREFDPDQALASALRVFWSKGYEGTSMNDLTEAMGITKPSLYAAFGNKEALFSRALDLYEREKLAYIGEALAAPTTKGVAEKLLRGALKMQTEPGCPGGCLAVISSGACGAEAEGIRDQVLARASKPTAALLRRFEQGQADGDYGPEIDPQGLTSHIIAVMQGLTVQAGAGASREQLECLVETSLAMWPTR
jgi:AcrR family transcriptional regulator